MTKNFGTLQHKTKQIINSFIECGPYTPKYSNQPSSTWELTYFYTSYFKWGGQQITDQPVQDPCPKKEYDISDNLQGNIQIHDPLKQNTSNYLEPGMLEGVNLQQQLLKECTKTSKLKHLSNLMLQNLQQKEKNNSTNQTPGGRKQRNQPSTPLTLRRKYMPRARPPPAHPAPATAATAAQERPHRHHHRHEKQTENSTTPNRNKLTPFKPGFEIETEHQLANAFSRPPRMFKEDPPFYPWLPRFTPIVNFHLNFKG